MISRVTMRSVGLADYLLNGVKIGSKYSRLEKDNVIPLYGNLKDLKSAEKFANKERQWKYNYEHIVISFSEKDMEILETLSGDEYKKKLNQITVDYLKHRVAGYDIDNEIIAYAEAHEPKIKYENGKKRLLHIHLGISYVNPLSKAQVRTSFYNNSFISDTLDKYVAKKNGLTFARRNLTRDKEFKNSKNYYEQKAYFKELVKDMNDSKDLVNYLEKNKINYRWVETKFATGINKGKINNKYIVVQIDNLGTNNNEIPLNGVGFENVAEWKKGIYLKSLENKSLEELENILSKYYMDRIELIDKRKSKKTKETLNDLYKSNEQNKSNKKENLKELEDDINSISPLLLTYQQKLFQKYYSHLIKDDLKDFFIKENLVNEKKEIEFTSKSKKINVIDKGNIIISKNQSLNLQEEVKLMLNIAIAKGWNIATLKITGNVLFKYEAEKQINAELERRKKETLSNTDKREIVIEKALIRPLSPMQELKKELKEKINENQNLGNKKIDDLKKNLKAEIVLDYAKSKYNINLSDYEITADNKIKNLTNKQKPKSIIDFFTKEIHLSGAEAFNICENLFKKHSLNLDSEVIELKEEIKEENTNKNNKGNEIMLNISICKDTNINALNKWETVQLKTYSELVNVMKNYPYSSTIFDNGYRNGENSNSFNNLLIYDIDNDKDTPSLTIDEARAILEKHNISAMILPSKSHNIEKNGHIAERYRIIIPTNKGIGVKDKDTFREFQNITAKALKIDKFVDKKALNDKSRFYYKSPESVEPVIIKSNKVMLIDNLEKKAIENISLKKSQKELEEQKLAEIKNDLKKYVTSPAQKNSTNLSYANVEKIINLNITDLIKYFEKNHELYKEGNYEMIKTNSAKYSLIEKNVAHDFKNEKTFNSLTYLQFKLGTTNLNKIARELENITGEKYMQPNLEAIKSITTISSKLSDNINSYEEFIKDSFNVKYCKLEKDFLQIADQKISLEDLELDYEKIHNDLINNRTKNKTNEYQL